MPDRGNKIFPAPSPKEIPRASAENPQMNPKAKRAKQAPQHCTRKSEEAIGCTTGFFQANGDPSCELRASWRLKKLHKLFFLPIAPAKKNEGRGGRGGVREEN